MSRTVSVNHNKHNNGKGAAAAKKALLFLQCDAAAFDDDRRGERLVERLIEQQRRTAKRLAADIGATIRREYVELGSGTTVADFTVLMDMLTDRDLLRGHIDYVIAPDPTYVFSELNGVRGVFDSIYDAGATLIPFRLDLYASGDPATRALLRGLSELFGDKAELVASGTTGRFTATDADAAHMEACL